MTARRGGFTLIELLVVMGILAVLAGIILPVMSTARGMARQAVCISSLRQIGLAWTMYVDDWGWQPPRLGDLVDTRYLPEPDLLVCPSDPTGDLSEATNPEIEPLWWRRYPTSYWYVGAYAPDLQRAVLETGPSAGIAVCVTHGRIKTQSDLRNLTIVDYDSLRLRLCADGSVVKRQNAVTYEVPCGPGSRMRGFHPWLLFTDLPLEQAPEDWQHIPSC